jgi:hypothetical protein
MSVWNNIAKLPEKDREKYLNAGKTKKNGKISAQKTFGGISYRAVGVVAPEGGGLIWRAGPDWDAD